MADPAATATRWRESICIDRAHASLPGHFPGRPVVPGVVVLDAVATAIERRLGRRVTGLPQVKFQQPLLPDERADLDLDADDRRVRFSVLRGAAVIASGVCETSA